MVSFIWLHRSIFTMTLAWDSLVGSTDCDDTVGFFAMTLYINKSAGNEREQVSGADVCYFDHRCSGAVFVFSIAMSYMCGKANRLVTQRIALDFIWLVGTCLRTPNVCLVWKSRLHMSAWTVDLVTVNTALYLCNRAQREITFRAIKNVCSQISGRTCEMVRWRTTLGSHTFAHFPFQYLTV